METSNPLLKRDLSLVGVAETGPMTLEGVVNKSGILLLLCLGAATFSWFEPEYSSLFIFVGIVGGLVACLVGTFKPATSPISAPIYAVLEGLALGAISRMINVQYPGIATNAFLLTIGVLAVMLALYATRVVRVTNKFIMGVLMATGAVLLVYVADMVLRMFGISVPYLQDTGPIGMGISLVIIVIAAFNLLVDFAVIEGNINAGAPKYMEWYSGMALLVTLVWLYMEILRFLSKLRRR